jgi:mannitol/fructose-specific phosphotransferase system IIA component (Ntr-type)
MELTDILAPQRVKIPLAATTKTQAIGELLDLLADNGDVSDREAALAAVLDRETRRSTCLHAGLAVPHAKTDAAPSLVMAVGKAEAPIRDDADQGPPLTLVCLLVGPTDQTAAHIQALARVAKLMGAASVRRRLEAAGSAEEFLSVLFKQEERQDWAAAG